MPWLIGVTALLAAGGYFSGKVAGLAFPESQTTTFEKTVEKAGSAASVGLLLVSAAFAYSLVKR